MMLPPFNVRFSNLAHCLHGSRIRRGIAINAGTRKWEFLPEQNAQPITLMIKIFGFQKGPAPNPQDLHTHIMVRI